MTANLIQCEGGHFFDRREHTNCPYCGVNGLDVRTTAQRPAFVPGDTAPDAERTRPKGSVLPSDGSDPFTEPRIVAEQGIDPVVGWLVCVEGAARGRDYRIRTENNSIGRSPQMSICISGDETVARDRHATITFEPRRAAFYLVPGDARGLVYLNGAPVLAVAPLQSFDELMLGNTKLRFVPFCGENFQWKTLDGQAK